MFEGYLTKVLRDSSSGEGFIIVAITVSCNGLKGRVGWCSSDSKAFGSLGYA